MLEPEPRELSHNRQAKALFMGIEVGVFHCQRRGIKTIHRIDLLNGCQCCLFLVFHDALPSLAFLIGTNVFRNCSHAGSSVVITRLISFLYAMAAVGENAENRLR